MRRPSRTGILLSFGGPGGGEGHCTIDAAPNLSRADSFARACSHRIPLHVCVEHPARATPQGGHLRTRAHRDSTNRSQQNSQWEMQFLNWGLLGCHWDRIDCENCKVASEQLRESARERSDPMSLFLMNVTASIWSDLSEDQVDRARGAGNRCPSNSQPVLSIATVLPVAFSNSASILPRRVAGGSNPTGFRLEALGPVTGARHESLLVACPRSCGSVPI